VSERAERKTREKDVTIKRISSAKSLVYLGVAERKGSLRLGTVEGEMEGRRNSVDGIGSELV